MTATAGDIVIAQRDLRNRVGEILRRAQLGQCFVVTTRGERVARLVPAESRPTVRGRALTRPATRRGGWDALALADGAVPAQQILDELRAER